MSGEIVPSEALAAEVLSWPEMASALAIVDAATYEQAGAMLADIKSLRAKIDETFDPIIAKAHEAHKVAIAAKKRHEDPLALAEKVLKAGRAEFYVQEENRRREQQARLEAEARKLAEQRQLEEALALEQAGDEQAALSVLNMPIVPPVVRVPQVLSKAGAPRESWKAQVVDIVLLASHIAVNPSMAHLIEPNMANLNALARTQKEAFSIPGVKVVKELVAVNRGK